MFKNINLRTISLYVLLEPAIWMKLKSSQNPNNPNPNAIFSLFTQWWHQSDYNEIHSLLTSSNFILCEFLLVFTISLAYVMEGWKWLHLDLSFSNIFVLCLAQIFAEFQSLSHFITKGRVFTTISLFELLLFEINLSLLLYSWKESASF